MKKVFAVAGMLLLAAAMTFFAPASQAAVYTVEAYGDSFNAGAGTGESTVYLNVGDKFTVAVGYNDIWASGVNDSSSSHRYWSNADGQLGNWYATGSDESGYAAGVKIGVKQGNYKYTAADGTVYNFPNGSLVGKIGTGEYFLIGTGYSGVATESGILTLYYWDGNYLDNLDSVAVTIAVTAAAVPLPASLLFFLPGLAGLAAFRKKLRK